MTICSSDTADSQTSRTKPPALRHAPLPTLKAQRLASHKRKTMFRRKNSAATHRYGKIRKSDDCHLGFPDIDADGAREIPKAEPSPGQAVSFHLRRGGSTVEQHRPLPVEISYARGIWR